MKRAPLLNVSIEGFQQSQVNGTFFTNIAEVINVRHEMSIQEFEDAYEGERLFLLGNGPSLKETPLHLINDEYTFGVNNIANIFDETEWRPTFFMAIHGEPSIPKENVHEVVDIGTQCFFPADRLEYVRERPNVERVTLQHLIEKDDVDFSEVHIDWDSFNEARAVWSDDVTEVVYHYTSILYPAMQLADYMGFSEIYLLGCDLYPEWDLHMIFESGADPGAFYSNSDSKLQRVYEFLENADRPVRSVVNGLAYHFCDSILFRRAQPLLRRLDDRFANQVHFYDTFDMGHFLGGNRVLNEKIIQSHRLARVATSERELSIYNATLGGSLEVHPRVDLADLISPDGPKVADV